MHSPYVTSFGIEHTKAYMQALRTVPTFHYGNMYTDNSLVDAHREKERQAVAGILPSYITHLSVYKMGERKKLNSSHTPPVKDGYDHLRMQLNIGLNLHDPATDIPSGYVFNEENALFLSHFEEGHAVNNSKGYQAVWFNKETLQVDRFAYVNAKNNLQNFALDDDLPASAIPVAEYLRTLTAPSYVDTLKQLIAVDPVFDKSFSQHLPTLRIV